MMGGVKTDLWGRTSLPGLYAAGETALTGAWGYPMDFFAREFWRFVMVQQYVAKLAATAIDYPPMQAPASFNLDAVKQEIQEKIKAHEGQ